MPTATSDTSVEPRPQLMLRREQAARACGKGTSTWDRMTAAGLTPTPIKLGGTVLWSAEELAAWVRHGCPSRGEWEPIWQAIVRRTAK
jgi:predicted DNA-binding transcriptional regulator AlpA